MTLMGAVAVPAMYHTVRVVGDIFRFGLSIGTAKVLLLVGGIALIGLSNAIVALLVILFPSRSGRSPRWFLVALGIGVVMTVFGIVEVLK